jgi:transcription elongation factor Elf1
MYLGGENMPQRENRNCPHCNSETVYKIGFRPTLKGKKQRFQCYNCGKSFYAEKMTENTVTKLARWYSMQKGKNSVILACTLELLNTLKEFSSKADQNEGYHLAKRLLMNDAELRERFIEKYGQTAYNEAVLHYSKTNLQQRAERKLKEEERKIREEAKLKASLKKRSKIKSKSISKLRNRRLGN